MIYPAEILSVDYNKHTCIINIPDLHGVNDANSTGQLARFADTPGISNGYLKGDRIWVTFIRDEKHSPVVIGHMLDQTNNQVSAIAGKSLQIANSASLPRNLSFTDVEADYNTLTKLINKLKAATNFIESNYNLEDRLEAAANSGGNGGSADFDASELEDDIFSNVTALQIKTKENLEFPIGKVLFVQNDIGKSYSIWSELAIYLKDGINGQHFEYTNDISLTPPQAPDKLLGYWRVKAIFSGGILAQRCPRTSDKISVNTTVTLDCGRTCRLFDATGDALTWYWADFRETLVSVKTNTLKFYDINDKLLSGNQFKGADVYSIRLADGATVIQSKSKSGTPGIDDIAVLNLRTHEEGLGEVNRLSGASNQGLFYGSTSLEYVYLNENYNLYKNTYNKHDDGYGKINSYIFVGAENLKEVYIPDQINKLGQGAFSKTTKLCRLQNLANTRVNLVEASCFHNSGITQLHLPKNVDIVHFNNNAFENYNNDTATAEHLKTIFAHSKLYFDANCFKFTGSTGQDYLNRYTLEIIYDESVDRETVLSWINDPEANYLPFYKNSADITELPANLNLVDGSSGYRIGSATVPTIVYGYTGEELN